MSPRHPLLVLALAAAFLPLGSPTASAAVPLSACADPDNGDPRLTSLTLSAAALDVTAAAGAVDVTLRASDTGGPGQPSGIAEVYVGLRAPNGSTVPEEVVEASPTSPGEWTARLAVPRGVAPGTYRPVVMLTDATGNFRSYGPFVEAVPGDPALEVASVHDTTEPRLRWLRLSDDVVDTRRRARSVEVKARVTDAGAGVKRIVVNVGADRRRAVSGFLERVSGSAQDGRWRGTLRIPRHMGTDTWRITRLSVVDSVVNVESYSYEDLRSLDRRGRFDNRFRVVSRNDSSRPTATRVRYSTTSLDLSAGDGQVVVRLRARDDASGVRSVRVRLFDPPELDNEYDTFLKRVSGSRRDGTWSGTVTVPRCNEVSGTWRVRLEITDRAGRVRYADAGSLQVTVPDTIAWAPERTDAGRPTLAFLEDVTGVDATSATVKDQDGKAVAGTWACTDSSGTAVDCATGALRRAVFTPTGSPAGWLTVTLNPEGSLGVTDLAGNPVGRRLTT